MKKVAFLGLSALLLYACGGSTNTQETASKTEPAVQETQEVPQETPAYDSLRGLGKFDKVDVGKALDQGMAVKGKQIFDVKCSSCHKLSDEKLVGPGWKGVTERHRPEWIMNFITNPDPMIDKDPKLQAQLAICMVRMPNQNLNDEDARNILEFMRQNDGVK